jgi:SpoVK/Ycf46/Vps4 family AAA+-type ATPase
VNISLETFLETKIDSYINFAYSKDWDHITERYRSAKKCVEANRALLIRGTAIQRLGDGQFSVLDSTASIAGLFDLYLRELLNDTFVLVFAHHSDLEREAAAIATLAKALADGAMRQVFVSNRNRNSGPVASVSDLRRASNVQDTTIDTRIVHPRILLVSESSEMPSTLSGIALNLGDIDDIKCKESYSTGMNYIQQTYVKQLMKIDEVSKQGKSKAISQIRKSIFTASGVVQDIIGAEDPKDIGGYEKVKEYFATVKKYIENEKDDTLKIKGSLFIGPAGTAKSKLLTAIPQMLGLPGYFLDFNRASGSLHGQTERQLIEAIETAKKYAPVVIAIDEIEKAVAGTGEGEVAGNEIATKVLGILLTAMSQDTNIYWVASANKVSHLPAPLLRRGRWDHLWYVPLPNNETRAKIFAIHCNKNKIDLEKASDKSINEVLTLMNDYTGAEIRHCIKEAAIKAIANDKSASIKDIIHETTLMRALVKDHKDSKAVAEWATANAVSVD